MKKLIKEGLKKFSREKLSNERKSLKINAHTHTHIKFYSLLRLKQMASKD